MIRNMCYFYEADLSYFPRGSTTRSCVNIIVYEDKSSYVYICYCVIYRFFFAVKNPEKDADPSGAMPRLNTIYVLYNSTPQRQYDRDSSTKNTSHRINKYDVM